MSGKWINLADTLRGIERETSRRGFDPDYWAAESALLSALNNRKRFNRRNEFKLTYGSGDRSVLAVVPWYSQSPWNDEDFVTYAAAVEAIGQLKAYNVEETHRRGHKVIEVAFQAGTPDDFFYEEIIFVPAYVRDEQSIKWVARVYVFEEFIEKMRRMSRDAKRKQMEARYRASLRPVERRDPREAYRALSRYMDRNQIEREGNVIGALPILPHGTVTNRKWGIEVESVSARGIDTPDGWNRVYDGSLESESGFYATCSEDGRHEAEEWIELADCEVDHSSDSIAVVATCDLHGWVLREGLSCEEYIELAEPTEHGDGGECAEFVSPILTSFHSRGLEYLTSEMCDRPTNSTPGIHVHVDSADLTMKQAALVAYAYSRLEDVLEESLDREDTGYCAPYGADAMIHLLRGAKSNPNAPADMVAQDYTDTRYHSVNLDALDKHGTIEFRGMGPVYEYPRLIRWAMFCRELVTSIANGASQKDFDSARTWNDILAILARYGVEYPRALAFESSLEPSDREPGRGSKNVLAIASFRATRLGFIAENAPEPAGAEVMQ